MSSAKQQLDALNDIKQMMERSSRFISLSGLSGVSAGVCALLGAWFAFNQIDPASYTLSAQENDHSFSGTTWPQLVSSPFFLIAILTFVGALVSAFVFTWMRSKKNNVPVWGTASRRLVLSLMIPMAAGGLFLVKLIAYGVYGLIAPGCLIFYGLALLNASKYTLGEIKYLAYIQIVLGVIGCWFIGYGLYFWAIGFGLMHIIYGIVMWRKYERN